MDGPKRSAERGPRRVVAVVLAAVAAAVVVGCAGADGEDVTQPGGSGTGPSAEDLEGRDGDFLPGRLGFVDVTGEQIEDVVAPYDGDIEVAPEGLRIVQVRFPVEDETELLEIRDELREQGYRVEVVPATDPGRDGASDDEFLDVEP